MYSHFKGRGPIVAFSHGLSVSKNIGLKLARLSPLQQMSEELYTYIYTERERSNSPGEVAVLLRTQTHNSSTR